MSNTNRHRYEQVDILEPLRIQNANKHYQYNQQEIKIVVDGCMGVGKSALIIRLVCSGFLEEYDPTIEDSYRKSVVIDEQAWLLDIFDTFRGCNESGEIDSYRKQFWDETNIFMFVYDITDRHTFEQLRKFIDEIVEMKDGEFFGIIVGNKIDLEEQRQVLYDEGMDLAMEYGNLLYYETSAREKINNAEIFYECARLYMHHDLWYNSNFYLENDSKLTGQCCVLL